MGMQYDVLAVHADADVQDVIGPLRVKAYQVASGGTILYFVTDPLIGQQNV